MLRKYFSTVFINIIEKNNSYHIKSFSLKKEKIYNIDEKHLSKHDNNIQNYIKNLINKHYFYYTSYLYNNEQEIIFDKNLISQNCKIKQIDNFLLSIPKKELYNINFMYSNIDLLYSPFAILHKIIFDKNIQNTNLFVLENNDFITITIAKNNEIIFAKHIKVEANSAQTINSYIKEFYTNQIYDSDFIQNIFIFEFEKSNIDTYEIFNNIFLIKPNVYKIDLFKQMLSLACDDLGVKVEI